MIMLQPFLKDQGVRLSGGISCGFCEHGNKPTVSVKDGTFLRNTSDYLLLKNDYVLRF
jgi:hypothetical protein